MLVISYGEIKTINRLPVRKTSMWGSKVPRQECVCSGGMDGAGDVCSPVTGKRRGNGDADVRAGDRSYGPT